MDKSKISNEKKYEEAGASVRFFLAWRQVIIGGYLSTLILTAKYILEKDSEHPETALTLFGVFCIGWLLWFFEFRGRILYRKAQEICSKLEKEESVVGYHTATFYDTKKKDEEKDEQEEQFKFEVFVDEAILPRESNNGKKSKILWGKYIHLSHSRIIDNFFGLALISNLFLIVYFLLEPTKILFCAGKKIVGG